MTNSRILTRAEIETARDVAVQTITALADEIYGSDEELRQKAEEAVKKKVRNPEDAEEELRIWSPIPLEIHNKKQFPYNVRLLAKAFLRKHESLENFSPTQLFEFLNDWIGDAAISRDGNIREIEPQTQREYQAAAEHLLNALDLKQQFMEYKRSLKKNSEIAPPL